MAFLKLTDPIPEKGRGSRLTAKQQAVVDAYTTAGGPGFRSWVKSIEIAGYKCKNPAQIQSQLSNHPLIVAEIKRRLEDLEKKHELTNDYVIYKLMDKAENAVKDADQIRAVELLGKILAIFRERQEISGPDGEAIKMEQKVKEDVSDFTSRLSRLATRSGADGVTDFPKREGKG